jgi:prepilin-type N-terminal cleavage/methylation domain-containing protein
MFSQVNTHQTFSRKEKTMTDFVKTQINTINQMLKWGGGAVCGKCRVCSSRSAFTLVELLVVIAIIGVLIALLLPAVQAAREAARRMTCTNCQKNLSIGMQNYHDINLSFPYGGMPFGTAADLESGSGGFSYDSHSWVSRILPYIEQNALYDGLDFTIIVGNTAVDTPHYRFRRANIEILLCPSDKSVIAEPGSATWGIHRDN